MFSGIWRKAKKKNMKKERKFGLKEFPRPLWKGFGGIKRKYMYGMESGIYSNWRHSIDSNI